MFPSVFKNMKAFLVFIFIYSNTAGLSLLLRYQKHSFLVLIVSLKCDTQWFIMAELCGVIHNVVLIRMYSTFVRWHSKKKAEIKR